MLRSQNTEQVLSLCVACCYVGEKSAKGQVSQLPLKEVFHAASLPGKGPDRPVGLRGVVPGQILPEPFQLRWREFGGPFRRWDESIHVPDQDRGIVAASGQVLAVGREGKGGDPAAVSG